MNVMRAGRRCTANVAKRWQLVRNEVRTQVSSIVPKPVVYSFVRTTTKLARTAWWVFSGTVPNEARRQKQGKEARRLTHPREVESYIDAEMRLIREELDLLTDQVRHQHRK